LQTDAAYAKLTLTSGFRKSKNNQGTRRSCVANSSTLKVRVDREKCQGHNRCKALAPELFELDEYGNAREKGDGTVPAGLEDKAYLAKSNCPEFAVEVIETEG
jgi:ferredoxin